MVRLNNEFALAWASLSGDASEPGWRTIPVTPAGQCTLRAGRHFPGNQEALLVGFASATISAIEKLPESQGFTVESVDLPDNNRTWLALTRKEHGSCELFMTMACDVAGMLDDEASTDHPRLLRIFLGRVRAWQEFMRKGTQALSPEAETGLIGELSLLALIIDAGVPVALALDAWVGPLDGVQDFEIGTGAIEVKTTVSSAGFPARIGSLEQLDDSVRQPLFLAGTRLRQTSSGKNLPDFICDLHKSVAGDAEATRLLAERLIAAGYFAAHADRYLRRFAVTNIRLVEVTESFPRLTAGRVPKGITKAIYEIEFDIALGTNVDTAEALKKLGAL